MAFFRSRTINLLNLHYLIVWAAVSGGGAFYAIWLLKAGIALWAVMLALASIFAARFVLRLMVLPIALRFGLKAMVMLGTVLCGFIYIALAHVAGADLSLARLVLITAIADIFYWPCYHAYYAALGEAEHRGHALGLREAANALIGVVSPLASAALLLRFGAEASFYVTALVQVSALLPLFFTPDVKVARRAPGALKAGVMGAALFVGDGLVQSGYQVIWQLVLYMALGRELLAYGGAQAAASLAGAVGGLTLGRWIDAGKGARAVVLSMSAMALVIVMRAGAPSHPALAVAANALGALSACLYTPTLMTAMYNLSKRSPCVLRFHLVAEGGWDTGVSIGLIAAALLLRAGVAPGLTMLTALGGLASGFVLLGRYYRDHAGEPIQARHDALDDHRM
jgi:hypothetical protein